MSIIVKLKILCLPPRSIIQIFSLEVKERIMFSHLTIHICILIVYHKILCHSLL